MRVHFIAIGGSAMHNLALALHEKGFQISGSDDEIFEPSRTRLENKGLLPEKSGWYPEKITSELDAVILGMHARKDNPELQSALQKGIKVYSYPEYLYEQTRNKTRVVIGGSHGKTTITSMVMHVLKTLGKDFDYMVGAQIEGFDTMVRLSESAPVAIFEGDEYLSSPIDLTPKFHWYRPHLALLSGIAWDHINVFPTWEGYVNQFRIFAQSIEKEGTLIYYQGDENLVAIAKECNHCETVAYKESDFLQSPEATLIPFKGCNYPVQIFGMHNMQNLNGAMQICKYLNIKPSDFLTAIGSFKGASKRLQLLRQTPGLSVYLDFAHSPSKLKATTQAVADRYPDKLLTACMELHTFSSLNKAFLPQYRHTMQAAERAIVFFNPEVLHHKQLPALTPREVAEAFDHPNLKIFTHPEELVRHLRDELWDESILLIMTSGNFSGVNLTELAMSLQETI